MFKIDKDEFFGSLIERGIWKAESYDHKRALEVLKNLSIKYDSIFVKYIVNDAIKLPEGYKKYKDIILWSEEREVTLCDYKRQEKAIKEACDFS